MKFLIIFIFSIATICSGTIEHSVNYRALLGPSDATCKNAINYLVSNTPNFIKVGSEDASCPLAAITMRSVNINYSPPSINIQSCSYTCLTTDLRIDAILTFNSFIITTNVAALYLEIYGADYYQLPITITLTNLKLRINGVYDHCVKCLRSGTEITLQSVDSVIVTGPFHSPDLPELFNKYFTAQCSVSFWRQLFKYCQMSCDYIFEQGCLT